MMGDIFERKGAFEAFRMDWLLQVAKDGKVKAATPVAISIASHLNRASGRSWPGIEKMMTQTGVSASNTIRNAIKSLETRGHLHIEWTKGGKKNTNKFTPLVDGKPFKKLKGKEQAEDASIFGQTLQVFDEKPFKKLKGNHLSEPPERDTPLREGYPLTPSSIFTVGDLTDLADAAIIPPDAARAARADIIEHFVSYVMVDTEEQKHRARRTIGIMFDRGRLSKNTGFQTVTEISNDDGNRGFGK